MTPRAPNSRSGRLLVADVAEPSLEPVSMALIRPSNSGASSDKKPVIRQPWEHVEDAPLTLALGEAGLQGVRFTAEVDLCELDEHGRAGTIWPARSAMLSRSHLVLLSRRMSFVGRFLLVAVHLIDDEPTPLMGRITSCDYHAHGLYKICIELVKISPGDPAYRWAQQRDRR